MNYDQQIFNSIAAADNVQRLITTKQSAKDITKYLLVAEKQSRKYVPAIAKYFKDNSQYNSAQKIWYFLKKNIPYQRENSEKQSAKTISRIIQDAQTGKGNDCKHYSILAVSILNYLNIPCFYRLVSFSKTDKTPTHAFAVAIIDNKEIYIDACLNYFNQETNYKIKYDIKPLN